MDLHLWLTNLSIFRTMEFLPSLPRKISRPITHKIVATKWVALRQAPCCKCRRHHQRSKLVATQAISSIRMDYRKRRTTRPVNQPIRSLIFAERLISTSVLLVHPLLELLLSLSNIKELKVINLLETRLLRRQIKVQGSVATANIHKTGFIWIS